MLKRLGPQGIAGLVVMLLGVGLVAEASLQIAAGIALVVLGLGVVVRALVSGLLGAWGMMG